MRFQSPQLGALGVTFTALRALQLLALVPIIGLTGNFINEFASEQREVPDVLVGTITVTLKTSISAIYVIISYILYYDGMLPLLISAALDTALLIATIVVAVTIGKPLSMLRCELLPEPISSSTQVVVTTVTARDTYGYHESAAARYDSFISLIATDQPHCYETKAVWGLDIALTVLLSLSALVCVGLWHSLRRMRAPRSGGKDVERGALGTRLLLGSSIKNKSQNQNQSQGQKPLDGFGSRCPPKLSRPKAAYRRPVGKDAHHNHNHQHKHNHHHHHHVPTPPKITVNANNKTRATGRSLNDPLPPLPVPPVPPLPPAVYLTAPQPAQTPYDSHVSPVDDSVSILYTPVPKLGKTSVKTPTLVIVPPPRAPSDDGFTPITPSPSPRLKAFKRIRASQVPRDALGIATTGFAWRRSQRAVDECDTATTATPVMSSPDGDDDDDDDVSTVMDAQLAIKVKPRRRTIFEVLEGWWDLGLLDRSKSLKRKGEGRV
ncbi:hypothetical protein GGR50DRAFT_696657 [Xylaria sp. CBS 124048]|nr:hypothetical protein GGR50DRAFT_696657 [Xylaria sp. CBS 124048]